MDRQIGGSPEVEQEWTVGKILSHAASGKNSHFEILWKAADITWLPYYQIRHLQVIKSYLDLLGINDVSKLPTGKGKPLREDPQIFLGP